MKKLILTLLAFLLCTSFAYAESITLAWTPSTSPDVTEYRVYQSMNKNLFAIGPECNAIVVNDETAECITKAVIAGLMIGYRYHFIVTAVDGEGNESLPSNMVSITISPNNSQPETTMNNNGIQVCLLSISE